MESESPASGDPPSGRVVVFGEVLFDVFPSGEEVLGGAPFNVAWHLAGWGLDPLLVSRVGRDPHGRTVRQAMERWGMDSAGLQEDPERGTGRVEVSFRGGQPDFEILRDRAWDHIDAAEACRVLAALPVPPALLYRGTLGGRSKVSREALAALEGASEAPVFLDLNLRPPWWGAAQVETALAGARWAQLSHTELEMVHGAAVGDRSEDFAAAARRVQRRWDLDGLTVTRGEKGALVVDSLDLYRSAPRPLGEGLVDAVGAGDAFAAVTILGLLRGWSPETILHRGIDFAAEICRRRGAAPEERALYRETLESWSAG